MSKEERKEELEEARRSDMLWGKEMEGIIEGMTETATATEKAQETLEKLEGMLGSEG